MTKTVELQTNHGAIRIELDDAKAPITVANFLSYVAKGHYDGTVFHRVIKGFMVQGGGFEPGLQQKATQAPIANEAGNGLKNDKYTLAMARTNAPHSATAPCASSWTTPRRPRPLPTSWTTWPRATTTAPSSTA